MSFPQTLTLKAFAKINLSLDITGILENGYHQLEMIMQSVSLHDKVTITTSDASQGISLSCSVPSLCPNEQNTAYKAANLFFKQCGIRPAVSIHIEKQIPSQAGLAGGSADAAAVLHGLNQLFQTNLTQKQLCEIGVQIGADVPFCISGNAALAQGIGEELTYIKGLSKDTVILVCKPNLFVSTKEVYEGLDLQNIKNRPDNKFLIECLKKGNINLLATNMVNVLETVTSKMHEEIKDIEKVMLENNALGSMMSGSGPTVFGLFDKEEDALSAKGELLKKYNQVYVVRSSEKGVEVNGEFN